MRAKRKRRAKEKTLFKGPVEISFNVKPEEPQRRISSTLLVKVYEHRLVDGKWKAHCLQEGGRDGFQELVELYVGPIGIRQPTRFDVAEQLETLTRVIRNTHGPDIQDATIVVGMRHRR